MAVIISPAAAAAVGSCCLCYCYCDLFVLCIISVITAVNVLMQALVSNVIQYIGTEVDKLG